MFRYDHVNVFYCFIFVLCQKHKFRSANYVLSDQQTAIFIIKRYLDYSEISESKIDLENRMKKCQIHFTFIPKQDSLARLRWACFRFGFENGLRNWVKNIQ